MGETNTNLISKKETLERLQRAINSKYDDANNNRKRIIAYTEKNSDSANAEFRQQDWVQETYRQVDLIIKKGISGDHGVPRLPDHYRPAKDVIRRKCILEESIKVTKELNLDTKDLESRLRGRDKYLK